jgi:AraC-like DNA-binding protein
MMRVSAIHVRALVEAVGLKGVGPQEFLQRANLDLQRLSDPYGWFSVEEFDALMLLSVQVTGDEAFGLHWGEQSPMMQYDVLPPLISQAKSLQEAIQKILRFQRILAEAPEVDFHDQGGRARFRLTPLGVSAAGLRLRTEMTAASLLRLLKLIGSAARPVVTRVGFMHPCPPYREEYERIFAGLACFEQSSSFVDFQYGVLDSPETLRNEELHHMLTAQAERVLQRVVGESSYSERLKRLVQSKLPEVLPMSEAARALGMSERSLRRRLSDEGASYSQLVEHSQIELACNMLENPAKTIKEVAHETGFAAQSAFHRAFKRWKGTSPAQYRARPTTKSPA